MKNPELGPELSRFEVIDITGQDRVLTSGPKSNIGAERSDDLNDGYAATGLEKTIRNLTRKSESVFLIRWKGGRVPRGAIAGNKTIGFMQNGLVLDSESRYIGTYERIKDSDGGQNSENEVVVSLLKNPI